MTKQYLWKLLLTGKSPVKFKELGRWWGTDSSTKSQAEIDIMGEEDQETVLFAECKWTNENVDIGVLEKLTEKSRLKEPFIRSDIGNWILRCRSLVGIFRGWKSIDCGVKKKIVVFEGGFCRKKLYMIN